MSQADPAPRSSEPSSNRGAGRRRGRGRGRGRPPGPPQAVTPQSGPNAVSATQPTRGRQRGFRGQLSHPASATAQSANRAPPLAPPTEHSSLQARLSYELFTNTAECAICMNNINPSHQIHSCSTCSAITHLKCISQWSERSIKDARERASLNPNATTLLCWRCPSCQSTFNADEAPKQYRCFCKRLQNPKVPPKHLVPHSCGQPCSRTRADGCTHPCPSLCHPGPCEPCLATVKTSCYCGKDEKWLQCATLHSSKSDHAENKTCNQVCGKTLSCGLHQCVAVCHSGPCATCDVVREKQCFCGQAKLEEVCSTEQHPSSARVPCHGASGQEWTGEFACESACTWMYDCGVHPCKATGGGCHPHSKAEPDLCPYSPKAVKTCPCGKTPLSIPRAACTDPIPSCSKFCYKPLACGHPCQQVCHAGACSPCQETVTSICNCGSEKRVVVCSQQDPEQSFTCTRQCKALRHCGRHPCGRICCPLSFQESLLGKKSSKRSKEFFEAAMYEDTAGLHVCPLICGRILSCGIHHCQANDHRGPCGRCLASEFSEVHCACGGTVLMPPVPCGTKIKCDLPCHRPGPRCGHPKVPHPCHENDVPCPPCSFLVEKECQCAKKTPVKNVRCSQEKISCGAVCNRILACGAHRCRLVCHKDGDCEACTQTCGKPRRFCGHPHEAPCHAPAACSTSVACQVMVDATCACGNNVQRMLCGCSTTKPTSAATTKLPCNENCATLKRNSALAEALGIDPSRVALAPAKEVEYDEELLEFYAANRAILDQMEANLADFVKSNRQTWLLPPMKPPLRHFIKELASLWGLSAQSLDAEPNRAVYVSKKSRSPPVQPSNSLADAYHTFIAPRAVQKSSAVPDPKAANPAQPLWNALVLNAVFGQDEDSLREMVTPLTQNLAFKLEWVEEEDVLFKPLSSLDPTELDRSLRNIRTCLLGEQRLMARQGIDGARTDAVGKLEWREGWNRVTASSNSKKQRPLQPTPVAWNRWDALN